MKQTDNLNQNSRTLDEKIKNLENMLFSSNGPRGSWILKDEKDDKSPYAKALFAGRFDPPKYWDFEKDKLNSDIEEYLSQKYKSLIPSLRVFGVKQVEFEESTKYYLSAEVSKEDYAKSILPKLQQEKGI